MCMCAMCMCAMHGRRPSEQGDLTEWGLQVVERRVCYFQDKHTGSSGLGDLEVTEYLKDTFKNGY